MPKNDFLFSFFFSIVLISSNIEAQELSGSKIPGDRMVYIRGALREALAKKDTQMLAEAWYLYGKSYAGIGSYKESHVYFLKSLNILERAGDSYKLGRLYHRLCEIEAAQGHYHESLRYAHLARDLFQRIHYKKGQLHYFEMLGKINSARWNLDSLKDPVRFDSLLFIYRQIQSLSEADKTLPSASATLEIGKLFTDRDPKLAIEYLIKAEQLYSTENKTGTAFAIASIAPAYINAGEFALALESLNRADKYYYDNRLNVMEFQLMLVRNYILYFKAINDWEQAFDYLQKLNALEKNQILADRDGAITRLNLEFETEKKEKRLLAQQREISLREANLETQQYFSWTLAALFLTAAGAGIVFFTLYRKNQQTSRWNSELLQEQNHRVKNNLQVISSLLHMQSKRLTDLSSKKAIEETRLRVESMAILHRRLYDGEKFAEINLDEFIREVVQGVLRSYGYGHIDTEFQIISINLSADKALRLGLILNELSTNSCKYAFPFSENPRLNIRCTCKENKLKLVVSDNGPGIAANSMTENTIAANVKSTLGLSLIQTQVIQLNGNGMFTSPGPSSEKGTEFTLEFKI